MFTFHNFNTSVTFFLLDKYSKIFYIQNEVNMYVLVERSTGKMNEEKLLTSVIFFSKRSTETYTY